MKLVVASIVLVSLVSCGAEEPPGPGAAPTVTPTQAAAPSPSPTATTLITPDPGPTMASACPNELPARSDDSLRNGGSLRGDVDGDGEPERVWVALDREGSQGCEAFLVVRQADGSFLSTALPFDALFGTFDPRAYALVELNHLAGYEIGVVLGRGAATEFLGLYGVAGATVVQFKIQNRVDPGRSIFGTYGSVGYLSAIDCSDEGIVVTTAVPSGDAADYRVKRITYELQGLFLVPSGRPQRDRADAGELNEYPEFGTPPLGSCPQG